ncbi:MAG TPA: ABC transporter permease [Ignavibacteriaceae bacterium]|nr:ABC transporter permease [Ignavibacteriaceae bacterium]
MFKNYLKIAFRNIRKYKVNTFINLASLAMGMAFVILISLWVKDELSYENSQKNLNDLYVVSMRDAKDMDTRETTSFIIPYALAPIMKQNFPEIIDFTRMQKRSNFESCMLQYEHKSFYEDGLLLVDPSFFRMFTYRFLSGSPQTALNGKNSIVLTRKTAEKFFGNENPIGKILKFNNRQDLIVSAVVEEPPHNSEIQFNALAPIQILGEEQLSRWWWESSSYILVRENTDLMKLKEEISGMIQKYNPVPDMKIIVGIQPLAKMHLYYGSGDIKLLYVFISVAIFILLIACINYVNLSTARFNKRAREVGLRKVMGAQRVSLVRQFLGESVSISILALLIAVSLVEILIPFFNTITDKNLSFISSGNLAVICSLFGFALMVGIIAGSYPAIFLSSFQPATVIKGKAITNSKNPLLRTVLVVTQFSIAIILIASTLVIYTQYDYMLHKDLGYNKDQIIYMPINKEIVEKYETMKNVLLQNSSIKFVTVSSSLPNEVGNVNPVEWEGKQDNRMVFINFVVADSDYLNTFKIKLSEGRNFSKDFSSDISNFIINKKAEQLMNLKNPVDQRISFMGLSGKVIGVVSNFNNRPLNEETNPLIMTINPNLYNYFLQYILIKVNSNDVTGTLRYIEKVSKEFSTDYPVDFKFLDETVDNLYRSIKHTWYLFEAFAFLAILISCMGLFGLASYMIELRTKEIGIRKTLGAAVHGVVILLSREFVKWVIIANLIALPVTYYFMNKWLQDFAYRIEITWWMFALSGGIALVIALATVSIQAVKAATANPVESLRYE